MTTVYSMIRAAIIDKKIVVAFYDGHERMMCPHVIGHKRGREQALFYQFAGGSSRGLGPPGSPTNWRCITLDKLVNVRVVDGDWHTAPNHSRPQTCVSEIDTVVDY